MQSTLLRARPAGRALRLPQVCDLIGVSPASIWRWVKQDERFPKPFKVSENVTVWDESELLSWLEDRKATRVTAHT